MSEPAVCRGRKPRRGTRNLERTAVRQGCDRVLRAVVQVPGQLAERAGVAVQYVQRIEAGKQTLTMATCVKFANALGVEVAELSGS